MWSLGKSRGRFFAWTSEPQRESFWVGESRRLEAQGVSVQIPDDAIEWNPSAPDARSNCQLLHEVTGELVSLVDPKWKARASAIYAGRTRNVDGLAYSKHASNGGVVVIGAEFTHSLIAFSAVWGRFLSLLDLSSEVSAGEWVAIETNMRSDFAQVIAEYQTVGLGALVGNWSMDFRSEEHRDAAFGWVAAAERWIVAHELAHHILRHDARRIDEEASSEIQSLLSRPVLAVELKDLNQEQLEEVEADLLAFELLAGRFAKDANMLTVIQAIVGSVLALVAVGHLQNEWLNDRESDHPGVLTRISVLAKWAVLEYREMPLDRTPGGPPEAAVHRLVALLVAYALWSSGLVEVLGCEGSRTSEYGLDRDLPKSALDFAHLAAQLSGMAPDDVIPLLDMP